MALTLYDISENYQEIFFSCLDDDADLDQLEQRLQALEGALEDKVANGIAIIQELKFRADNMDAESKRLAANKKALENKISWLKNYYLDHLNLMGKSKVLTNRGTMSVVKSGGKRPVKIDDEDLIPAKFKLIIQHVEIDKDALRQAMERGESVSGAHLEERGKYLKIA